MVKSIFSMIFVGIIWWLDPYFLVNGLFFSSRSAKNTAIENPWFHRVSMIKSRYLLVKSLLVKISFISLIWMDIKLLVKILFLLVKIHSYPFISSRPPAGSSHLRNLARSGQRRDALKSCARWARRGARPLKRWWNWCVLSINYRENCQKDRKG